MTGELIINELGAHVLVWFVMPLILMTMIFGVVCLAYADLRIIRISHTRPNEYHINKCQKLTGGKGPVFAR